MDHDRRLRATRRGNGCPGGRFGQHSEVPVGSNWVGGLLGFALLVLYGIASAGTWTGLAQRTFVSVLFMWIAVLGFRLTRVEYVETGAR